MIKAIGATLILLLVSMTALAVEYTGYVKGLNVDKTAGLVLVNLVAPNLVLPQCATGAFDFTFNLADTGSKQWVAMLLTAKVTNTQIKVGYITNTTNACSVVYFYFYG